VPASGCLLGAVTQVVGGDVIQQDVGNRMRGGNVGWPLILRLAASACKWPYCRTPMHAPDTNAAPRLRIAHVLLSHGFAGSERSTAESCAAQCVAHDVLVVIRHDHRSHSGASIRDHLDPRARWSRFRPLVHAAAVCVLRDWRPDVVHAPAARDATAVPLPHRRGARPRCTSASTARSSSTWTRWSDLAGSTRSRRATAAAPC
jgi:hypothetical protein